MSVTACVTYERRVEKPRAASSVGIGRRAKRETVLVSYNDLDATLTGRIIDTLTPTPSFWIWYSGVKLFFAGDRILICKMRSVVLRQRSLFRAGLTKEITIDLSLSARLPTPALRTARGFAYYATSSPGPSPRRFSKWRIVGRRPWLN